MSRLTQRNEANTNYYYPLCFEKCHGEGSSGECDSCRLTDLICEKLGQYEDAEEQGLLLRLKLKVGDEFWELNENFLEPAIYQRKAHSLQHVLYCMDRLGKVTFLTKEEAEQKLAEMKGE